VSRVLVGGDASLDEVAQLGGGSVGAALQRGGEIIHTYEGTETMQTLIVGRDITGIGAFA
jgi:hypothetical protein